MNQKNIGLFLLLMFCFAIGNNSNAQSRTSLRINEVLIVNDSNFVDDYGMRNGWIEIWNSSYSSINIGGCYLTNDKNDPKKYLIPKGDVLTLLKPRQHLLFWADSKPERGTFHISFSLDSNKDNYIGLYDSNGQTLLDEVVIPAGLGSNQSYARVDDGSKQWTIKDGSTKNYVTPSTNNKIEQSNIKTENFKKYDSNGFGLAIIAMSVVFSGLILLYFVFSTTGKVAIAMSNRKDMKEKNKAAESKSASTVKSAPQGKGANEDIIALSMALHEYFGGDHDVENMVLTFKETGTSNSPWNLKLFGLRNR